MMQNFEELKNKISIWRNQVKCDIIDFDIHYENELKLALKSFPESSEMLKNWISPEWETENRIVKLNEKLHSLQSRNRE